LKHVILSCKSCHGKSSNKINIPVELARETGIDKAEMVIVTKSANNKIEVKRYDKEGDIREYISDIINELNRSS